MPGADLQTEGLAPTQCQLAVHPTPTLRKSGRHERHHVLESDACEAQFHGDHREHERNHKRSRRDLASCDLNGGLSDPSHEFLIELNAQNQIPGTKTIGRDRAHRELRRSHARPSLRRRIEGKIAGESDAFQRPTLSGVPHRTVPPLHRDPAGRLALEHGALTAQAHGPRHLGADERRSKLRRQQRQPRAWLNFGGTDPPGAACETRVGFHGDFRPQAGRRHPKASFAPPGR